MRPAHAPLELEGEAVAFDDDRVQLPDPLRAGDGSAVAVLGPLHRQDAVQRVPLALGGEGPFAGEFRMSGNAQRDENRGGQRSQIVAHVLAARAMSRRGRHYLIPLGGGRRFGWRPFGGHDFVAPTVGTW